MFSLQMGRCLRQPRVAVDFAMVSDDSDLVHCKRIGAWNIIFDAEAKGILCALKYVEEFGFRSTVVAPDSLSVMRCLESPDLRGLHTEEVYQIEKLVLRIKESGVSVKFVWIPRQCEVKGNERADKHAKLALSLPELVEKRDVSSLFLVLKLLSVSLSREYLLRVVQFKSSRYFRFVPKPLSKPWFTCVKKRTALPCQLITLI